MKTRVRMLRAALLGILLFATGRFAMVQNQGTEDDSEAGGHTYGTKPQQAPEAIILQILPDGYAEVVYQKTVPMSTLKDVEFGEEVPAEGVAPPITGVIWKITRTN